jgi:two-component system, sensor histidine kinase and response regulator
MLFGTAVTVLSADSEVTDTAPATPSLDVDRIRGARVLLVKDNEIIVAMTASAMASDRELCLEAGMNDHIAKPIDPDQLFSALLHWIRRGDADAASSGRGTGHA